MLPESEELIEIEVDGSLAGGLFWVNRYQDELGW